jgi:transcriptional regulator with XRE-family HTH domain
LNNSLGETLKHLRIQKGLSQQQCADLIHVDRSSIANWETGRRMPDADMLAQISNALNVDVSYLIGLSYKQEREINVIMVDDERIILTGGIPVIQRVLPDASVNGFIKPSEALNFARENKVAIAFLDIEIGKVSGLSLCQDLLTINPLTNVIFLTAYAEYSLDAWETGTCGFLLKPISDAAVKKQLAKLRHPFHGGENT